MQWNRTTDTAPSTSWRQSSSRRSRRVPASGRRESNRRGYDARACEYRSPNRRATAANRVARGSTAADDAANLSYDALHLRRHAETKCNYNIDIPCGSPPRHHCPDKERAIDILPHCDPSECELIRRRRRLTRTAPYNRNERAPQDSCSFATLCAAALVDA